jgi:hypothetical protein
LGTTGDNFEVEANPNSLRLRLAEGYILTEFGVPIGHSLVTVTDPETQQVFRSSLLSNVCDAKSSEGMESGFLSLLCWQGSGEVCVAARSIVRARCRWTIGR